MKRVYFLVLIMIITLQVKSQYKVEVETGEKKMSKGNQTAITVLIPNSNEKEIETLWNKYVNNRTAGEQIDNLNTQIANIFRKKENRFSRTPLKMEKIGDELYIRSVDIRNISSTPLNVYAKIIQKPEGVQLSAFFQYPDSVFINESVVDSNKFALFKDYVRDFGVNSYKNMVDNNLKAANRDLSREHGRLKDLQASTNREEKAIIRNQAAIQEFKNKISELQADSASVVKNIASKKDELSAVKKDSVDYVSMNKELNDLEKEKLRNSREIRALKGRIKSKEMDIESSKEQIAANNLEIENQKKIINNKQQVAEDLIKEKGGIE